jgi:uncharacterized DUF497 family protein
MDFEWHESKNQINIAKHGVSFEEALRTFDDPNKLIEEDLRHSTPSETRFFCWGKVDNRVMTVRFTIRDGVIRIIGAGYWRKGEKQYEKK